MKRLILLISLLLVFNVFGVDRLPKWNTPARWSSVQDSIHAVIKTLQGGTRDSVTGRTNAQNYDTTWLVSNSDSSFQIVFYSWADGSDSSATWTWIYPTTRYGIASAVEDTLSATHGTGTWGTGDGSNKLALLALDTTGHFADPTNGSLIEGVTVTVRNAGDVVVAIVGTDGNGLDTVTLVIGDAYSYTAFGPAGYTWISKSISSMSTGIDTVFGQNYLPGASPASTPGTSSIWGWITTSTGDSLYGATVEVSRADCGTAVDSGSNVIISHETVSVGTNTSGYFVIPLVNSDEIDNADCGWYTFKATYNKVTVFKTRRLWITGGFNIADSISARP